MFVHIGNDIMIDSKDIIMILDYPRYKKFSLPEDFLKNKGQSLIVNSKLIEKNIKTIIITTKKVFFSNIAPTTLAKRISQ
jgi:hypothetical protein